MKLNINIDKRTGLKAASLLLGIASLVVGSKVQEVDLSKAVEDHLKKEQ